MIRWRFQAQVPINGQTVHMGTGIHLSDFPTYQELKITSDK